MTKLLAMLLLFSLTLVGLSANGTNDGSDSGSGSDGQVSLRTVTMFGGTDPFAPLWEEMQLEFLEQNPNVSITDESAKADDAWKQRVLTDFAVGNEPDVMFFFTTAEQMPLVNDDKIVSVQEIQELYPTYGTTIKDGALSAVQAEDGNSYGLPIVGFYEGMIVNKALFEEYNVEVPTDWASFETAVRTFSANGIIPISAALGHVPNYLIEHFVLAQEGVAAHQASFDSSINPAWTAGLEEFKRFADMGAFPVDTLTIREPQAQEYFLNGQAAMYVDGNWFLRRVMERENADDFEFVAFPSKADVDPVIAGFTSGWFISRRCFDDPAKREAAVALVQYLTSNDGLERFANVNGQISSGNVIADLEHPFAINAMGVASNASGTSSPIDSRLTPAAWVIIKDAVPYLVDGSRSAQDVLEEALAENQN